MATDSGAPRNARAKAVIEYLTASKDHPFAILEAVSGEDDWDFLDLVVEPELPQDRKVDIRTREPCRIAFPVAEDGPPHVFARRDDFPLDLVHTSFDTWAHGRSLCIWEENWADLKRSLSAQALIERIRAWLARTALGVLHQAGQPLEAMIPASASTLILPPGPPPTTCHVASMRDDDGRTVALIEPGSGEGRAAIPLAVFSLTTLPQVQGAMRKRPTDLVALRDLMQTFGIDLVAALGDWIVAPEQLRGPDRPVLLLIIIPKRASARGKVKDWDIWAFTPSDRLVVLGERLGRTAPHPETGLPTQMIGQPAAPAAIHTITLAGWRVVQRLDRAGARKFSGSKAKKDLRLVGLGAGAIGSNVVANTVRAGIGTWTIVDYDINLPHNGVRQVHFDPMVGQPKAEAATDLINAIHAEGGHHAIQADYLDASEKAEAIAAAIETADLVVDFSASPAVLGAIGDDSHVRRAASCFFNPSGSDLVMLTEDQGRTLRLDEIDAQYFLAVASEPLLSNHFDEARTDFLRYANACQDLTRPLPPWQVQTLCGIAAGRLAELPRQANATARIWRLNPANGAIIPLALHLHSVERHQFDGFRVSVSRDVVATMQALRAAAAPNETGGVLLGSFDLARRVVHVLAALPAPPDSRQTPTYFVRGAQALKPLVEQLSRRSAGVIDYLGEWHSHPDGCPARPSKDDEGVFAYLSDHLHPTGSPYLMAICGAKDGWFRAGWQGVDRGEGVIHYV